MTSRPALVLGRKHWSRVGLPRNSCAVAVTEAEESPSRIIKPASPRVDASCRRHASCVDQAPGGSVISSSYDAGPCSSSKPTNGAADHLMLDERHLLHVVRPTWRTAARTAPTLPSTTMRPSLVPSSGLPAGAASRCLESTDSINTSCAGPRDEYFATTTRVIRLRGGRPSCFEVIESSRSGNRRSWSGTRAGCCRASQKACRARRRSATTHRG